jgi:hypothetical protein
MFSRLVPRPLGQRPIECEVIEILLSRVLLCDQLVSRWARKWLLLLHQELNLVVINGDAEVVLQPTFNLSELV